MTHISPAPSRLIRLFPKEAQLLVEPPLLASQPIVPYSFPLPKLPLTEVHWCCNGVNRFWKQHQSHLAVALMLDLSLKLWMPIVPPQTCSGSAVRWNPRDPETFSAFPSHLVLAGSFQSAPPGDMMDALKLVPEFDGIHLVWQARSDQRALQMGLVCRSEGQNHMEDSNQFLSDDLDAVLLEASGRLKLE